MFGKLGPNFCWKPGVWRMQVQLFYDVELSRLPIENRFNVQTLSFSTRFITYLNKKTTDITEFCDIFNPVSIHSACGKYGGLQFSAVSQFTRFHKIFPEPEFAFFYYCHSN